MNTVRRTVSAACAMILLLAAVPVWAEESDSAKDAKAMLERAVAAVKMDEAKALAAFNIGSGGFKDRDLFVFCARLDGRIDAHIDPTQLGGNLRDLYDVNGVAIGQEMLAIAREGEINAVSYMWPKLGSRVPAEKVSFVTRVADQICGVSYYR